MLGENLVVSPNKVAIKALWHGSARHPLETETFCHASSLRSGLFSVAGSPRALSQEGDGMMAWGRKERSGWQSEPATSIKSPNVALDFFGRKVRGAAGPPRGLLSTQGFHFCLSCAPRAGES